MATGGPAGGAGGSSAPTLAATRIDVVDPHILTMMRDVMSDSATAPRLKVSAASGVLCAGGGGGGGGGHGGVIIVITTSASIGTTSIIPGELGGAGASVSGQAGGVGEDGSVGKVVHIQV
jgi:hypothetical protein